MGWGRTLFSGEAGWGTGNIDCEKHIESLRRRQQMQTHVDRSQDEELRALREENGELKLYLAAVVDLLIAKKVFHRDEFLRLSEIIDGVDGELDGQLTQPLLAHHG